MKEPRFIELLNLYVDQQLTAAEATELEAEIQRNPARRRTYQQYCRMQKACAQLFEQERQTAPSTSKLSRALADADRKVIAFPAPRRVWLHRGLYATGIAAMAACLALVFVRMNPATPQNIAEQPATAPSAATESAVAVVEPVKTATPEVQTVAIPPADPKTREMRKLYYAVMPARKFIPVSAITTNGEQAVAEEKPDFAWMQNMEFTPMRPIDVGNYMTKTNNQAQTKPIKFIGNDQTTEPQAALQYSKGN